MALSRHVTQFDPLPCIVIYDNLEMSSAMPYYEVFWNYDDEDGNVAHVAQHDLTPEDVNAVLMHPDETRMSRSSGRPIAFEYASDGRYICVVYEQVDELTLYPIAAFEVEDGYCGNSQGAERQQAAHG